MVYVPPSVQVSSVVNSRIINITEETRIPAIIGPGPSLRVVSDYAITRTSGSAFDVLAPSGSKKVLTRIAQYPGAAISHAPWHLYYSTSGSSGIYWGRGTHIVGTPGVTVPRNSETYYVSYTYPVPSTQFDPLTFTDTKDIIAAYGAEGGATSQITTAASMCLENGAPAVICLQMSGSSSLPVFSKALDKLRKKSEISYVVPISTDATYQSATLVHCLQESAPTVGHEREAIFGMGTAIGSADSFLGTAQTFKNSRVILVAPSQNITRSLSSGTILTLDGSYVAAAVAGTLTGQASPIVPVTNKVVTGFVMPDDQYTPYDMNRMAVNGVMILYAKNGIVKIRHALTTDPTSANTSAVSIVASDDLVRRITRNKLTDAYIGKGIVITSTTVADVAATVGSIWNSLVRQGLLASYGTKNDPTTGEVPISAAQDPNNPTTINVTGSVKFLYPLDFIIIQFSVYI
jgi:hypothetical protein